MRVTKSTFLLKKENFLVKNIYLNPGIKRNMHRRNYGPITAKNGRDGTGPVSLERTKNSASSHELGPETARVIFRHTHKPFPQRYCLGRQNSFQFIDKLLIYVFSVC